MPDYEKMYKEVVEQQEREDSLRRKREYDDYLQREEERRVRREEMENEISFTAETWQQAFRRNIRRLKRELAESLQWVREIRENGNELTPFDIENLAFWRGEIRTNKLAAEYLDEEMAHVAPIIAKLQAKIDKLERRARQRVVKRIEESIGNYVSVEALVDGEPSDILQW